MSQEIEAVEAVPVPPASPRQVVLGLFILFQLAFLILSNMLGLVQWVATDPLKDEPKRLVNQLAPRFANEEGHAWAWCERAEAGTRRWMQLTGQDQDWSLFSPSASKATGVPIMLLLWDRPTAEGPSLKGSKLEYDVKNGFNLVTAWDKETPDDVVWLPSHNAPKDDNNYIKVGNARVRRIEGQFYMNGQPYDNEARNDAEERMSRRMRRLITDSHDATLRYLQWRLRSWQREHPQDGMPSQVILLERFYRIHDPHEPRGWDGPFLVPQVRWQPDTQPGEGKYLLEPFDYSAQRFQAIAK